jgi:hypothetical protein
MSSTFYFDISKLKKRILIKNILLLLMNIFILGWTFINADPEKKQTFFFLSIGYFGFLSYFLYQSFKKQIDLIKNRSIEIKENLLQIYNSEFDCTSINLKRVNSIEKEKLRGFTRYTIMENKEEFEIMNILDEKNFEEKLKQKTRLEILEIKIDKKELFIKIFLNFIPSFLSFLMVNFKLINWKVFYLVLCSNFIFLIIQISEEKMKGGFTKSTVRRLIFIFIILIIYILVFLN